jgi:hypothetical protein
LVVDRVDHRRQGCEVLRDVELVLVRHPRVAFLWWRADTVAAPVVALFDGDDDLLDLIHVSCSGYAAPSPAQRLLAEKRWHSTAVTHSYHMGCYGAFPAIRTAILDHTRDVLGIGEAHVAHSRRVLHEFGNMSSATVPFILMDLAQDAAVPAGTRILSLGFGPGLTAARLNRAGAIAQEALRLRAVAPLQFIENTVDTVLGGVQLPRQTWVVLLNRLGGQEKHFAQPNQFVPERWLASDPLRSSKRRLFQSATLTCRVDTRASGSMWVRGRVHGAFAARRALR